MSRTPKAESKGNSMGSKSQRRSPVTQANVERRATTRAARLQRAAQRRLEPSTGKTAPERRAHDERRARASIRIGSKRVSRQNKRNFKQHSRRGEESPTAKGEIQFGPRAKGHHVHQREHGLARALTPDEFQKQKTRKPVGRLSQREKDELAFITHAATGE
jgi:hypothetical protein